MGALSLAVALVRCQSDCPEGHDQRFNQCVPRAGSAELDGGAGAPPDVRSDPRVDGGRDGGADADASCDTQNDPNSCGASCQVCRAPQNGTVACIDGQCVTGCSFGYAEEEGRCRRLLYVAQVAEGGDDTNDGTYEQPLASFGAAMEKAGPDDIVHFRKGTWGPETGDDFKQPIPIGVAIRTDREAAKFDGAQKASLVFAGKGLLHGVELIGFITPFSARSGEPTVSFVEVTDPRGPVKIAGNAQLTCETCRFKGSAPAGMNLIEISENARATFDGLNTWYLSSANLPQHCGEVILTVVDQASVTVAGGSIVGPYMGGLTFASSGKLELTGVTINSLCGYPFSHVMGKLTSTGPGTAPESVLIDEDCDIYDSLRFTGPLKNVRVRDSDFYGIYGIHIISTNSEFDLGRADDPGNNRFHSTGKFAQTIALNVMGSGVVVHAVGNAWHANEQGAGADGRYDRDAGTVNAGSGKNFEIFPQGDLDAGPSVEVHLGAQ